MKQCSYCFIVICLLLFCIGPVSSCLCIYNAPAIHLALNKCVKSQQEKPFNKVSSPPPTEIWGPFTHSFHKHLLNFYYVPRPIVDTRNTVMKTTSSWSHEDNILLVEIMNKQAPKHTVCDSDKCYEWNKQGRNTQWWHMWLYKKERPCGKARPPIWKVNTWANTEMRGTPIIRRKRDPRKSKNKYKSSEACTKE